MFSVRDISEKIAELRDRRLSVDAFEDWFLSASWGHYGLNEGSISDAIASVDSILSRFEAEEVDPAFLAGELERATRPFVLQPVYVCGESPRKKGPQFEDGALRMPALHQACGIT